MRPRTKELKGKIRCDSVLLIFLSHGHHHDYEAESLNNEKQRDMSHDNHFNFEVNKSPKNGKQKGRHQRRGEKGGLTIRWVAFENKSKCLYVLGMSQVWVRFAICC